MSQKYYQNLVNIATLRYFLIDTVEAIVGEDNSVSMWSFLPVAIRFVGHDDIYGVSGVVLVQEEGGEMIDHFILTIGYFPKGNYKILVTSNYQYLPDTVNWYPAILHQSYALNEHPQVAEKIHFFKNHDFKLLPYDTVKSNNNTYQLNNLTILQLKLRNLDLLDTNSFKPMTFDDDSIAIGDPLTINSFPFNFTNSLLFSNFISRGTINYKLDGVGYLTDVKYLENTLGAIVNTTNDTSVGLILGQLSKLNGDGDLTLILSWNVIWHYLQGKSMKDVMSSGGLSATLSQLPSTPPPTPVKQHTYNSSVFPILQSNNKNSKWGSCIYYKPGVFITNNHVIDDFTSFTCQIFIKEDRPLSVKFENIKTPFKELDLSFILVDKSLDLVGVDPIKPAVNYNLGDEVSTIGYGLFFNKSWLNPLKSWGHITCKMALPIVDNQPKVNSIIVTSSSCWNGSSGGGLFNLNRELIGLICCNAQVKVPTFDNQGNFINNVDKVEKLSTFALILPIEIIDYCFEDPRVINPDIINLWLLNSFHNDIIVESSKL